MSTPESPHAAQTGAGNETDLGENDRDVDVSSSKEGVESTNTDSHDVNETNRKKSTLEEEGEESVNAMEAESDAEKMDIRGSLQFVDELDAKQSESSCSSKQTADPAATVVNESNSTGDKECGAKVKEETSDNNVSHTGGSQSVYHVKWIKFKDGTMPIVTQNENGPCPLLAIINVLILKGQIVLPNLVEIVTSGQLMEYLGDCMLAQTPKNISESAQLNYEQNMHDAMAVFHKLQTGLDVNVKFTGVADFEYTPECIVFDLLNVHLFHGWLVDPQNVETVNAIGNYSYNQLVEQIIASKSATNSDDVHKGLVLESFLETTASQLTYHGLCELSTKVKEDELCVFFRNNHFCTLYKQKGELFLLVTDQGFLTENNIVWETLANTEGDSYFVDWGFHTCPPAEAIPPAAEVSTEQQINQDFLVALSLQEEHRLVDDTQPPASAASGVAAGAAPGVDVPADIQLSDHDLALQLQEEENLRAAQIQQQLENQQQQQQQQQQHQQQQQQQQQQARQPRRHEEQDRSTCTLL